MTLVMGLLDAYQLGGQFLRDKVYGLLNQKIQENGPGLLAELKAAPSDIATMFSPQFSQQVMAQSSKPAAIDKDVAAQMAMDFLQTTIPVGGLLGAIKAYHGSPYQFDKFDMSKIGTGEGAQSFGHGLYFSDSPNVGKYYANSRWSDKQKLLQEGIDRTVYLSGRNVDRVRNNLVLAGFDRELITPELIDTVSTIVKNTADDGTVNDAAIKAYEKLKTLIPNTGNMYEVNLRWPDPVREAADPLGPQHFLDWDKPIGKQTKVVRDAIKRTRKMLPPHAIEYLYDDLSLLYGPKLSVNEFLSTANAAVQPKFGEAALKKAGIPGIRYLDGFSRPAGEGTSNYVIFDDALVEILKRNGVPLKGK